MKVVVDIEANALVNPTEIWAIVCKDISSGSLYVFRNVTSDRGERERFISFARTVTCWIGHNLLGYDYPILRSLIGIHLPDVERCTVDTLIVSKLVDYSREGHSVEDYGYEFGMEKLTPPSFKVFSEELIPYCTRDVEITEKIYLKYQKIIEADKWQPALALEHAFQMLVNDLHDNGFYFNVPKAQKMLENVEFQLEDLDRDILEAFPPKLKLIREVHPKETKHGTLSKTDFRFVTDGDLSAYNGGPFSRCHWVTFNPSSHRQIVEVLGASGWSPVDRTKTHVETERELNREKFQKGDVSPVALETLSAKLDTLKRTGWKVNENNLDTLPEAAPPAARMLAKRILLESRRRTLTEWLGLVQEDNRIHGKFYGIGAWTHRMAHQQPNTANIPSATKLDGTTKLLGREMRELWCAPRNRLLVGVDAEGIQLRIFAHYIDDPEFTDALVRGRKEDKTDPHSLNQRVLGPACKTRAAAKRFIYALLLGAGLGKLAEILEAERAETESALHRLLQRYEGFAKIKSEVLPKDGRRGYFIGLDGRLVNIPGETPSSRAHLAMSGYLQNGEAVVMKRAALLWNKRLKEEPELGKCLFVNMVHDEFQTEVVNDLQRAIRIAHIQAVALEEAGASLELKCPMAGSYWNDDHGEYTIGRDWYTTH